MTPEQRDKECFCEHLPEESQDLCSVCEQYYDDHCEEFEENKRKKLFEQQEY